MILTLSRSSRSPYTSKYNKYTKKKNFKKRYIEEIIIMLLRLLFFSYLYYSIVDERSSPKFKLNFQKTGDITVHQFKMRR